LYIKFNKNIVVYNKTLLFIDIIYLTSLSALMLRLTIACQLYFFAIGLARVYIYN